MSLLVAAIVTLFATAFGRPQYWVSTNGVINPHYYQQPLTYFYPGMTHQTNFHANPLVVPYTYPVTFATPSVVQKPKVQPYFFLEHCGKLKDKMTDLYNLVDANLDGKITLAEFRDDTLDTDPRVTAIMQEVFGAAGVTEDQGSADDNYTDALDRPLFAKNDVNKDNSLNVEEFSNTVGDMMDISIFVQPHDTNRDYYIDKTEYDNTFDATDSTFSTAESVVGSNDGKLSVLEYLKYLSVVNNFVDGSQDFCARRLGKTRR